MEINQYTAYSVISSTENKNNSDIERVLQIIESFSKIKTIEKAKEFLNKTYKIKDSVREFPLGANSFLDVKENLKKYSVKISYAENDEKECVVFCFKK